MYQMTLRLFLTLEESPQASKQSVASCYSLSADMELGCFAALTIESIVRTT